MTWGTKANMGSAIDTEPGCTPWRTCTAWGVTIVWAGTITRLPTTHRSTRKVRNLRSAWNTFVKLKLFIGKYLLEREKLVKENKWKLDE